jgi:hypothetical protein
MAQKASKISYKLLLFMNLCFYCCQPNISDGGVLIVLFFLKSAKMSK